MIWQLPQDAAALKAAFWAGEIFAYPTEAVWGIGANPADAEAVQAVLELKTRSSDKGLIMVAADWAQLSGFIAPLSHEDEAAMMALQAEYPTTFIVPAGEKAAAAVRDSATGRVAVRISAHPVVQTLCRLLEQPLLSTSANPAGQAAAMSIQAVQAYFPALPCVAGELGGAIRPSRIIDWQTKQVIRK